MFTRNQEHVWFQLQFIETQINELAINTIFQTHFSYQNNARENYTRIFGTPEHARRKKQMRNRQSNIVGTPEHERRKKQMKERQAKLVGTPEHQRRKQKMKSQLANVVGTPEYEKHKAKSALKSSKTLILLR